MTISRSIQVTTNGSISFFFMAEQYSIVYMCHIFIHSSVGGLLGCFFLSIAGLSLPWLVTKPLYLHEGTVQRPQKFSCNKDPVLGLTYEVIQSTLTGIHSDSNHNSRFLPHQTSSCLFDNTRSFHALVPVFIVSFACGYLSFKSKTPRTGN